ncbi:hypothetical protein DL93DRAFT_2174167 [Clavulina sp. PMI_390]|nr:hypothetical protein DL93DRAFT_2174167 [Clavulina sp. PMI_390]
MSNLPHGNEQSEGTPAPPGGFSNEPSGSQWTQHRSRNKSFSELELKPARSPNIELGMSTRTRGPYVFEESTNKGSVESVQEEAPPTEGQTPFDPKGATSIVYLPPNSRMGADILEVFDPLHQPLENYPRELQQQEDAPSYLNFLTSWLQSSPGHAVPSHQESFNPNIYIYKTGTGQQTRWHLHKTTLALLLEAIPLLERCILEAQKVLSFSDQELTATLFLIDEGLFEESVGVAPPTPTASVISIKHPPEDLEAWLTQRELRGYRGHALTAELRQSEAAFLATNRMKAVIPSDRYPYYQDESINLAWAKDVARDKYLFRRVYSPRQDQTFVNLPYDSPDRPRVTGDLRTGFGLTPDTNPVGTYSIFADGLRQGSTTLQPAVHTADESNNFAIGDDTFANLRSRVTTDDGDRTMRPTISSTNNATLPPIQSQPLITATTARTPAITHRVTFDDRSVLDALKEDPLVVPTFLQPRSYARATPAQDPLHPLGHLTKPDPLRAPALGVAFGWANGGQNQIAPVRDISEDVRAPGSTNKGEPPFWNEFPGNGGYGGSGEGGGGRGGRGSGGDGGGGGGGGGGGNGGGGGGPAAGPTNSGGVGPVGFRGPAGPVGPPSPLGPPGGGNPGDPLGGPGGVGNGGFDANGIRNSDLIYLLNNRFKLDNIPNYDGDYDKAIDWFSQMEEIAQLSPYVRLQLGLTTPQRFEGALRDFYLSVSTIQRSEITQSWNTLGAWVRENYLGHAWRDYLHVKLTGMRFRDAGHSSE